MNIRKSLVVLMTITLFLLSSFYAGAQTGASGTIVNTIEGFVYDESHTPVYNAYVELYNELGTLVSRQRSTSSGRFIFRGMPGGRYSVSVKPFGTNLLGESKDVEVVNTFRRSDSAYIDFRLKADKRFESQKPTVLGTVFAQDVPEEARKLYKSALGNLDSNSEKGLNDLEQAIKIFPTYFEALTVLGKKYVLSGKYEKGYPYLLSAIDVNPKCPDCFYTLGLAFYKMGQIPAAVKAAESAVALQSQSPEYHLLLGLVRRLNSDFPGAEKALLSAKNLTKEPNAEVFRQLSLLYNKMGRNQDAADALEAYLKASPDLDKEEKERTKELITKLRKSKNQ